MKSLNVEKFIFPACDESFVSFVITYFMEHKKISLSTCQIYLDSSECGTESRFTISAVNKNTYNMMIVDEIRKEIFEKLHSLYNESKNPKLKNVVFVECLDSKHEITKDSIVIKSNDYAKIKLYNEMLQHAKKKNEGWIPNYDNFFEQKFVLAHINKVKITTLSDISPYSGIFGIVYRTYKIAEEANKKFQHRILSYYGN